MKFQEYADTAGQRCRAKPRITNKRRSKPAPVQRVVSQAAWPRGLVKQFQRLLKRRVAQGQPTRAAQPPPRRPDRMLTAVVEDAESSIPHLGQMRLLPVASQLLIRAMNRAVRTRS